MPRDPQEVSQILHALQIAEDNFNAAMEAAHRAGFKVLLKTFEVDELGEDFSLPVVETQIFDPLKL